MHTPGPWTLEVGTSHFHVRSTNGRYVARGMDDKEGEANAILIAAAPELLEALHMAFDAMVDAIEREEGYDSLSLEEEPFVTMRKAIAKAEGREG